MSVPFEYHGHSWLVQKRWWHVLQELYGLGPGVLRSRTTPKIPLYKYRYSVESNNTARIVSRTSAKGTKGQRLPDFRRELATHSAMNELEENLDLPVYNDDIFHRPPTGLKLRHGKRRRIRGVCNGSLIEEQDLTRKSAKVQAPGRPTNKT